MKMLRTALKTTNHPALAASLVLAAAAWFAPMPAFSAENGGLGGMLRQLATKMAPDQGPAEETTGTLSTADALARAKELGGEKGISEATGLGESPSVFDDPESLRNLLGDNPRWVWNIDPTRSRPDPMLIPWVAEKLLYEARDAEAKALEGLGKLDEALKIYNSLLTQVTDPQYRVTLEERMADLTAKIAERDRLMAAQGVPATQPAGPAVIEPELPQYVLTETRGIIYDPAGDSFIAVGDQNLRVGEAVEGFPSVRVKSISYQTAVFSVTNESMTKDFVVKVQGDILEIVE